MPDVLITAVGTKVWRLDAGEGGGTRGTATGAAYCEDAQWARTLDEGWDLQRMRQFVQEVADQHGDSAFWLVRIWLCMWRRRDGMGQVGGSV